MTMAAQQRWQPNNGGSLTTMAAQQQWHVACENGSVAGGTPREHKAIVTRAREGANVAGEMPRKHKAILGREQAQM
jgi:hypothetical protein